MTLTRCLINEQKAAYASILCALKIRDELGEYDSNPKVYAVAMSTSRKPLMAVTLMR